MRNYEIRQLTTKENMHSLPYYWSKTVNEKTYELCSERLKIHLLENGKETYAWTFEDNEELIHFGNVFVHHFDRWIANEEFVVDYLLNYPVQIENSAEESLCTRTKDFIAYYDLNGTCKFYEKLNTWALSRIHGMMVRCTMKNGDVYEGFANSYGFKKHYKAVFDFISLWTWDNLDEESHLLVGDTNTKFKRTHFPVHINDIKSVDAILYSNPHWGTELYNHFFIDMPKVSNKGE